MDILRNCLKSLVDMDLIALSNSRDLRVNNIDKLIELADYLTAFKCWGGTLSHSLARFVSINFTTAHNLINPSPH